MKKIIMSIMALIAMSSVCFAHTMREDDMYVGGVGPECILSYVESVYGKPVDKQYFDEPNLVKGVTYVYSEYFTVTGRVSSNSDLNESDYPIVAFSAKTNSLIMPNGVAVGMPYSIIVQKYGNADHELVDSNSDKIYMYTLNDSPSSLCFSVNKDGLINEIYLGTDF